MGIQIIDQTEDSRVPFLRGILTRSLQKAGLSFNTAYDVANEVRDKLDADARISRQELYEKVMGCLEKRGLEDALNKYKKRLNADRPIVIIDRDSQPIPFSKGRLAQSLEVCAFPQEERYVITSAVEQQLKREGQTEITSSQLAETTYRFILEHEPREMAERYLRWIEFSRSGRPLILLIGGTTGSGKSTIGSELAHLLNIVRTQSTDMLREVMRLMLPERLLPALHRSSFNAWRSLHSVEHGEASLDQHLIEGYLTQSNEVAVGIEGVLRRAEREQVSLIIEGIHVHPALQRRFVEQTNALVIPVMLAVLKRKQLRRQLKGRGQQVSSRRSERYLENFDAIWKLQNFLLMEADKYQVPIIPNEDEEETIQVIMETISDKLEQEFSANPEKAFA